MAFITNHLSFLFLIFLFSCSQLQARESKFFSKFTTSNLHETELPQEQVSSLKQEEPTFAQQTTNGYGLYGHDSRQMPSTTTTSASREFGYANIPEKTPSEGYHGEGYQEKKVPLGHHVTTNYAYNTKQYDMSDTRYMDSVNGYETKQYESKDTRFPESRGYAKNNNNGYEANQHDPSDSMVLDNGKVNSNNGYVYETKQGTYYMDQNKNDNAMSLGNQQGLSDTRFMENGRYFYNVNNENSYLNRYQPVSKSYDGFRSSQGVDSRNNYNYNNNQNAYEFDNSMGDSKYKAEENQNEFSP